MGEGLQTLNQLFYNLNLNLLFHQKFKQFQRLVRMTQVQLTDPFAKGNPPEGKLRQYEKVYVDLKNEVLAEDKEVSNKQTSKLKDFIRQIHQIKNKVAAMRNECLAKNIKLKQEIEVFKQKQSGFQLEANYPEQEKKLKTKINQHEKTFINNCQKRIQIALSIDLQIFKKLEIQERKSLANEVFKWILVAVYVEPENKFYWPNFQQQVIENKQGSQDLRERLGKFDAYHAKQDQRVKTIKFLEAYQKIIACPELVIIKAEIEKIFNIAKIFLECSDLGRQVKELEKKLEQVRKESLKGTEQSSRIKEEYNALNSKYKLSELYLKQLTKVENSLLDKLQAYNKEVELAETYIGEISNITVSKLTTIEPKVDIEKREQCECSIF